MLLTLKYALLSKGIRQNRMAADLRWDPGKLSRVIQEITQPSSIDRQAIANYLGMSESELFRDQGSEVGAA